MVSVVICWHYEMPFDTNGHVSMLMNVNWIKWMDFCIEFAVGVNDSIFSGNEQQKVYIYLFYPTRGFIHSVYQSTWCFENLFFKLFILSFVHQNNDQCHENWDLLTLSSSSSVSWRFLKSAALAGIEFRPKFHNMSFYNAKI